MRHVARRRIAQIAAIALALFTLLLTAPISPTADAVGSLQRSEQRGLDRCAAPSHAQMKAFWDGTPYYWWGIYIGGSNMGCANTNITANWVATEVNRGYGLLPIWVGPQAPCTSFGSRISWNTDTAYDMGVAQATNAYNRLMDLGFATDTPVIYNMEKYNAYDSGCLASVKAFVRGWTGFLHGSPAQKVGVYSSACSSGLTSLWSISPRPDFVWAAKWDNVNDVYAMGSCIDPDIWPQRHKQYRGEVSKTYNGVTLTVDVNCAQGPMYGRYSYYSTVCR